MSGQLYGPEFLDGVMCVSLSVHRPGPCYDAAVLRLQCTIQGHHLCEETPCQWICLIPEGGCHVPEQSECRPLERLRTTHTTLYWTTWVYLSLVVCVCTCVCLCVSRRLFWNNYMNLIICNFLCIPFQLKQRCHHNSLQCPLVVKRPSRGHILWCQSGALAHCRCQLSTLRCLRPRSGERYMFWNVLLLHSYSFC